MPIPRLRYGIFILTICALSGCSNLGKSYNQIDPERASADVRQSNGYFSLQTVSPGMAKLVMRSEGSTGNVQFSINTSSDNCKDFQILGTTKYSGEGVVYPWIAKLVSQVSRTPGFLSKDLAPGQSVLIRSYGSSVSSTSVPDHTTSTRLEKCGPLFSRFTPIADHAYLVRFDWGSNSCTQNVFDATNPDAPIPVPSEAIVVCEKP